MDAGGRSLTRIENVEAIAVYPRLIITGNNAIAHRVAQTSRLPPSFPSRVLRGKGSDPLPTLFDEMKLLV